MAGGEEPLVFAFIMLWRGKEDSPQPIAGQDEKGQPFGQLAAEERLTRAWQAAHHYKRRLYLGLGQVVVKALPQSCHIFSQGTCHNRSIITMTQRMCQDARATATLDIISRVALDNACLPSDGEAQCCSGDARPRPTDKSTWLQILVAA